MKTIFFAAASAFAAWAGMAVLCFRSSSQRYRMGLPEQDQGRRRSFAMAGTGLLLISLVAAVAVDGTSFGTVLWLCQAGILGLIMICLLPYARAGVIAIARAAAFLIPLLIIAGGML